MKYIDSDKLIAEIERQQRKLILLSNTEQVSVRRDCALQNGVYTYILDLITSLQQEQPRSKFVKVRCVFPFDETWEKDKIYTCEVWHHGDLNRNFWDVYYDYGKDPKYVQFPTIESLNEEFAIIKDESQVMPEQPEADLEKEIGHWMDKLDDKYCTLVNDYSIQDIKDTARHFWNKGYNAKKEE